MAFTPEPDPLIPEAANKAAAEAYALLEQHFDHVVLITEYHDIDNDRNHMNCSYHG